VSASVAIGLGLLATGVLLSLDHWQVPDPTPQRLRVEQSGDLPSSGFLRPEALASARPTRADTADPGAEGFRTPTEQAEPGNQGDQNLPTPAEGTNATQQESRASESTTDFATLMRGLLSGVGAEEERSASNPASSVTRAPTGTSSVAAERDEAAQAVSVQPTIETRELRRPPLQATRAVPLVAALRNEDYPRRAKRAGAQGSVTISYVVGSEGRVTRCDVIASSGNDDLDRTTCRLATKRFRYSPARDSKDLAMEETITRVFEWYLVPKSQR
jgi:TonB family protein